VAPISSLGQERLKTPEWKWLILGVYLIGLGGLLFIALAMALNPNVAGGLVAVTILLYAVPLMLGGSLFGVAMGIKDLRAHPELRTRGNLVVMGAGIVALVAMAWAGFNLAFR